jgi:hypothetical protein
MKKTFFFYLLSSFTLIAQQATAQITDSIFVTETVKPLNTRQREGGQ